MNFLIQGGDILLETISSNVTEDVITLEFQRSDGTLVTQLIDFKNASIWNIYSLIYAFNLNIENIFSISYLGGTSYKGIGPRRRRKRTKSVSSYVLC